jgi:hypothetical protein
MVSLDKKTSGWRSATDSNDRACSLRELISVRRTSGGVPRPIDDIRVRRGNPQQKLEGKSVAQKFANWTGI